MNRIFSANLRFEPDPVSAGAYVAWIKEHHSGADKRVLYSAERASSGVGGTTLNVLDRDFGDARSRG